MDRIKKEVTKISLKLHNANSSNICIHYMQKKDCKLCRKQEHLQNITKRLDRIEERLIIKYCKNYKVAFAASNNPESNKLATISSSNKNEIHSR